MPVKCDPPVSGRQLVAQWKKTMAFTPDLDERAATLALLGNPMRLRMFYLLEEMKEVCVCDMADILGVTQSAISQHLAKFRAYGLVSARRDNQTIFYSLSDKPEVRHLRRVAIGGIEAP